MKTKLILLFTLLSSLAFAHQGFELGPNGGRILQFSKDETLRGEVTVKGDQFHIALLDKDLKPVAMTTQSLTATSGERSAPVKLVISKDEKGFLIPLVKPGQWLILQFKETSSSKAITARLEYNTTTCEACANPEWLCKCAPAKE